jgi:predicted NBD/HSP70 family sugar kinase
MVMKVAVGIDIGGTNTAIGLVDCKGNVLGKGNIPTPSHGDFERYINELASAIRQLTESGKYSVNNIELTGIGIGAPAEIITAAPSNLRPIFRLKANFRWLKCSGPGSPN